MTRISRTIVPVLVLLAFASAPARADDDEIIYCDDADFLPEDEMKRCAELKREQARQATFERPAEHASGAGQAESDSGSESARVAALFDERKPDAPAAAPPPGLDLGLDAQDRPTKRFEWSAYVKPQFLMRYRPDGLPRDRMDYSAAQTTTGLELSGEPVSQWKYRFSVEVTGELFNAIAGPDEIESGDSGDPDGFHLRIGPFGAADAGSLRSGINLEEMTVAYEPIDMFGVKVGQMRIPLTAAQQNPNTSLMFPNRSGPNDVFLRGSDLGALSTVKYRDLARASAGVFNGSGISEVAENERGIMWAARVDVDPLGEVPIDVADFERGPLRVGIGAGMSYMPSTLFDGSGFETVRVRDLRASASVRLAARGLFFQGEVLRRQRTDSLSSRPLLATGAYGQSSYYIPVKDTRYAVSPIARIGWSEDDQGFDPRTTVWTEAGVTLFIGARSRHPNDLRITLQYLGERRLSEGEDAHGAVAQVQMQF